MKESVAGWLGLQNLQKLLEVTVFAVEVMAITNIPHSLLSNPFPGSCVVRG